MRWTARGDRPIGSKLKCNLRQAFGGGDFSRLKGAKSGVRSLLLDVYETEGSLQYDSLQYAGHVTPHLSSTRSTLFAKRANAFQQAAPPFYNAPEPERERVFHWLTPGIVVEVLFLA
ncbi:DNA polymerase LigD ligase subunit [Caballeronia fortuita]|uniref:DNA ligase (ATP) n=1 Tax=Caballeronia fortuita TaxID=1777138 RepID=A0A158CMA1_9BURK|nr:hypothetical protein [Caballeronia fortuita]SAK83421.1 DNA polymerase LigD ligase subunit [Caballeronia fortuita]